MTHRNGLKRACALSAMGVAALSLSGCLGPTYGTDKSAGEQLVEDLSTAVKLGRSDRTVIQYNPRPDLVKPEDTSTLPPPQQNIVKASEATGEWPESQEERLARIRKEAEEGKVRRNLALKVDENGKVINDDGVAAARIDPAQRVYLTDPPAEYRTPAGTADYGDLGVSESKKERARKRASNDGEGGWRRWVPWL